MVFGDFEGGWIYVATTGGPVRALVRHFGAPPYDRTPAWSPRGNLVAFSRDGSGATAEADAQLYVVHPNGKGPRLLTTRVAVNPTWSPDGTRIAFDDHARIGVVGADGHGLRYLVRGARDPSWSPDGATIAFERGNDIWLLQLADKNQRLLVKNAEDPTWVAG